MTSRGRVLAAMNYEEPGRVPVDFSGHRSSGIMAIAYAKFKDALGITSGGIYVYDVFQQVHNIMADVPPENVIAMLDAVNS